MELSIKPQWLLALDRALRRMNLPVHEIVGGAGRLSISLRGEQDLVAIIRPIGQTEKAFATTRRFVLGYEGVELDDTSTRWMATLLHVIRHVEVHLPPSLEEPCAMFARDTPEEEQFLRLFPFCTLERSDLDGEQLTEVLVRTTARCNQACPFCSGPPSHPTPSHRVLLACFNEAARIFPNAMLTLTGGEPTLRATFVDEVVAARELVPVTQVQTNAVAFAERIDPAALPTDGVKLFVSLHALRSEIYDRYTGSQGQLDAALRGTQRLCDAGHRVIINCVVSSANRDHLLDYVRALPRELPNIASLHFSVLICPEHRPKAREMLVRYSELSPLLEEAHALARALDLHPSPLRSSTHASMPACVLSPELRVGRSSDSHTEGWVKAPSCESCVETERCLGVPAAYAELFGLDELIPIQS